MKTADNLFLTAFVSGKGGVGKTMLAVAYAHELSRCTPTLLFDLDFFNRGLTGLMRHGTAVCDVPRPSFLAGQSSGTWCIIEVASNLYHCRYPDLAPAELAALESVDVQQLARELEGYLRQLAQAIGAAAVVIDCHGGPDRLSFAACLLSRYCLIISEPDKITFYGTLHFIRQLAAAATPRWERSPKLHLVFNKVVSAFSARYLNRFYDAELRDLFKENPLLAIFPLEVYLTKEFERTPILTDVFPYSLLAKKMEVLVVDLLSKSNRQSIPKAARALSPVTKRYRRLTLGKTTPLLNIHTVMAIITFGVVVTALYGTWATKTRESLNYFAEAVQRLEQVMAVTDCRLDLPSYCRDLKPIRRAECVVELFDKNQRPFDLGLYEIGSGTAPSLEEIRDMVQKLQSNPKCNASVFETRPRGMPPTMANLIQRVDRVLDRSDLRNSSEEVRFWYRALADDMPRMRVYLTLPDWDTLVLPLEMVAVWWFLTVVALSWSRDLDQRFTYYMRTSHFGAATLMYIGSCCIWGTAGIYYYGLELADFATLQWPWKPLWILSTFPLALVAIHQLNKAYREWRYEHRAADATARIVFVAVLLALPPLAARYDWALLAI